MDRKELIQTVRNDVKQGAYDQDEILLLCDNAEELLAKTDNSIERKAFSVRYNTAGMKGNSEILIVEDEKDLEIALENKSTKGFKADDEYSCITVQKEIPLSKVKLAELSITEFLLLNS